MNLLGNAIRMFRPFGRLRLGENPYKSQKRTIASVQGQDGEYRVTHSTLRTSGMRVLPNRRISAVLGSRRLHNWLAKALRAAALVSKSSIEVPYISKLASRSTRSPSPMAGGFNGEA